MSTAHELTVEIGPAPLTDGRWRLVATCSCLGFARTGTAPTRQACQHATGRIRREHATHLTRLAAGTHHVQDRPAWLD